MRTRLLKMLPLLAAFASLGAHASVIRSGFDTDLEGWTSFDGGSEVHVASGGNPGGYLEMTDVGLGSMQAIAPSAFLGNLSAYLGGALSFDAFQANQDSSDWGGFGTVRLSNGGLTAVLDIAPAGAPGGSWNTYSAVLDPSLWFGDSLSAVLANLTGISIELEDHDGVSEVVGFDNFTLTSARTEVPEPGTLALLAGAGLVAGLRRRRRV